MPQAQQRPDNVPKIDMSRVDDQNGNQIQSAGVNLENTDD